MAAAETDLPIRMQAWRAKQQEEKSSAERTTRLLAAESPLESSAAPQTGEFASLFSQEALTVPVFAAHEFQRDWSRYCGTATERYR